MNEIKIKNKIFIPLIEKEEIQNAIKKLALTLHQEYKNETPVFVGILSGVVMFISDFLKYYPGQCELAFMKLNSYKGTQSTEQVISELDITNNIIGKHVVILEDIIDTGNTLEKLYQLLKNKPAKSVKIATLFFKPEVYKKDLTIDLIGMHIPNKFVIGFGLDYDGLGRNNENLYQLKE